MFNDVDIVLDRVSAVGAVVDVIDEIHWDFMFPVYFASMSVNPNPMWFGVGFGSKTIVDFKWQFNTLEEAKTAIDGYRDELLKLISEL
jgi:hypothetical protein